MELLVLNFTAADLDGGDAVLQIADTLAAHQAAGKRIVAVVTAMAGVNDLLLDSIRHGNYASVYTKLLASHNSAARRLARDEGGRKVLIQDIADLLDSYNWLGKSLANRTPTPAEADNIATLGDRLAARLLAANLQGRGISAAAFTASEFLKDATPDQAGERVRSRLTPMLNQGYIIVVSAAAGVNPPAQPITALIQSVYANQ